ncbi:integrase catalytic domain-containing protein [Trichonephila clavipes]|nr:integrase catalytic domain-containing protein [Trichonephila clavipes]
MFSDNGKTFVGANIELKKLHDLVKAPDETLVSYFNDEHIDWNFIPPRSPNFGGLWESGVKSFKTHLKRVAGSSNLTLEEFITLLAEIEAALNSRPHHFHPILMILKLCHLVTF